MKTRVPYHNISDFYGKYLGAPHSTYVSMTVSAAALATFLEISGRGTLQGFYWKFSGTVMSAVADPSLRIYVDGEQTETFNLTPALIYQSIGNDIRSHPMFGITIWDTVNFVTGGYVMFSNAHFYKKLRIAVKATINYIPTAKMWILYTVE